MPDSNDDLTLPSLQELQSSDQLKLLDAVDSLRACGLSEIVNLPQLIVCGDQSSGKSSVLEAISGIPFPRQDTLCTRFATVVILRRATEIKITGSIEPGEDRNQLESERLKQFHRILKTKEDFEDLFRDAREAMGLSATGESFSNDKLRVEFCGPSQPQLTLVDLPGLIHYAEPKPQTTSDVQLVNNLVSVYLKSTRSIILAVVSAKNDISNQVILRRAREVDPQGLRTFGIITKPDLLVKGSKSEEAFITLAKNEHTKFPLGWHVVKNLDSTTHQIQNDTRDQQEIQFFQDSSFNCLPTEEVGICSLRSRLSGVLFSHIRTELPPLIEDIQSKILAAKVFRDKLGPSRERLEDQRRFLISLSQTFQTICRDAVRGDYDHEFFKDDANSERRLCAKVMNMHFDFAKNMRKNGATWLVECGDIKSDRYRTRDAAIKEAYTLLKRSRGRELPGLPNPLLVGELFREYSRPWGDLARLHIKNVWEATNRFLELLLRHLADADTCENVLRYWLSGIMDEKLNSSFRKLDELLEVHKDHPMTTNSYFIENSRPFRQKNNHADLEAMVKKALLQPEQKVSAHEITHFLSTLNRKGDLDMDMVAAEEAFHNMNAYYDVAMNLFTDNVPTLAIQAPIIREVPNIFCPTAVFSMDADIVKQIAGETEDMIRKRQAILRRLSILEDGAKICKQHAKWPQPFVSLSSEELNVPEPSTGFQQGSRKPGENAPSNSTSPPRHFPEPVPSERIFQSPFGILSTSAQQDVPSSSNSRQAVQTENRKTFITPETLEVSPGPNASNYATKTYGEIVVTKSDGGLFSSTSTPSLGSIFGKAAAKPSGGENATTKPSGSSLFDFGTAVAKPFGGENATTKPGVGLFGIAAAKPFGGENVTTRPGGGLFGSFSTPTQALSGESGFPSAAKNVNSLNKVPDHQ